MATEDKTKKNTRFSGNKKTTFMIVIMIILAVFIVVEIAALIKTSRKEDQPLPTRDVALGTDTPEPAATPEPGSETPEPSGEATINESTSPTQPVIEPTPTGTEGGAADTAQAPSASTPTPTTAPVVTPTPANTPSGSTPSGATPSATGIDEVAARIIDPAGVDFSFLNGVSRDHFEDCSEGSFDWYPGAVKRDASGNVTYPWDRYASTLGYLKQYGGIYRKNTDRKVAYLTFDCGYENGYTEKILDTLKAKNVPAIFFVTGGYVDDKSTGPIMQRMLNEGHLIGSHTEHHYIMPTLSDADFMEELNSLYRKLKATLGSDFTTLFYRPPQGASSPRDLALASYMGYHTVFWAFAYGDYDRDNQPDPAASLQKMKDTLHPGCVYLLHAISSTNSAVLGDLIDFIHAEGYEIRRIDK
ncbi:MAG: polysaccharide deacetylase family protein [Clostridia bacterium]|nr:polysaccharide deacetylase family protein [Clostridia bacterium]